MDGSPTRPAPAIAPPLLDPDLLRIVREHRRQSLKTALWTVMLCGPFFSTLNGGAIAVLANLANLHDRVYGLIQALQPLALLIQIPGALYVAQIVNRPGMIFVSGALGRLLWIPVGAIPFFLDPGHFTTTLFIVLIACAWMAQHISGLTWQSLMGDLVPARRRGKYFGVRVRIFSVAQLLSTLVVAFTLPKVGQPHAHVILFATLTVVSILGAAECFKYREVYDPPRRPVTVKLSDLGRPLQDREFRPFLIFGFIIAFANGILAPFLWRHLLTALEMRPWQATLILQTFAIVGTVLTAPLWGRWMDRHGTKPAMILALIGSSVALLAWPLVSAEHWWVGLALSIVSTGFYTGVDVSLSNRLFGHGSRGGPGYFAVFNATLAISGFTSTYLGGELVERFKSAEWVKDLASSHNEYGLVFNAYTLLVAACFTLRMTGLYWLTRHLPRDKPTETVAAVRLMVNQIQDGITSVVLYPVRFIRRPWTWR